jgi:hypothetical protein
LASPDGSWLPLLEQASGEDRWMLLCFLAGRHVVLDPGELHGALRRAELLLAAGGDPRRPLELRGRAVTAVAADLDAPAARDQLRHGLETLLEEAAGSSAEVEVEVQRLLADGDLAWQCFACAVLAEALAAAEDG